MSVSQAQTTERPVVGTPSRAVVFALRKGVIESRLVFPENGPVREIERWETPSVPSADLPDIEARLQVLADALAPAPRAELLARILALLCHYKADPNPPEVEQYIADDWAEDLGIYPMWAVNAAARQWRRTKKFKPQPSEMIALCEQEVDRLKRERNRLRLIVEKARADDNPLKNRGGEQARNPLRLVSNSSGT
jgi:hypothetical protein